MRTSPSSMIFALLVGGAAWAQEPPAGAPPPRPAVERPEAERLAPALVSEPRELFTRGVELVKSGHLAQAKAVFKALTLAYPDFPEPWVNLAVVQAAEGDTAGSAESAEAALLAHPVCSAAFRLELLRDLSVVEAAGAAAEPTAAAVATGPTPAERSAAAMVHAWAAAWADQRVDDYLAFYGGSFRPADGASREAWEARRRERIARPEFIELGISDLEIEVASPGRAVATFTQTYRSDSFRDVVRKMFELARMGESWRIAAERSAP